MGYRQSIAEEKGCFPEFVRERYLEAPFVRGLPGDIRDGIARHGIRNSHLLAIAPTGTISLLAGNVSSGVEPVFAPEYRRIVLNADGEPKRFSLIDYAVRLWREQASRADGTPDALVTAAALPIEGHLDMRAALQPFVDNSISKTINVPVKTGFADFAPLYWLAYDKGLKGCTTFRPTAAADTILAPVQESDHARGCTSECQ